MQTENKDDMISEEYEGLGWADADDEEQPCKNCRHTIWRNKVNPEWNHKRVTTADFTTCFVKLKNNKYCKCHKPE